jgi:hypothetical protein
MWQKQVAFEIRHSGNVIALAFMAGPHRYAFPAGDKPPRYGIAWKTLNQPWRGGLFAERGDAKSF